MCTIWQHDHIAEPLRKQASYFRREAARRGKLPCYRRRDAAPHASKHRKRTQLDCHLGFGHVRRRLSPDKFSLSVFITCNIQCWLCVVMYLKCIMIIIVLTDRLQVNT